MTEKLELPPLPLTGGCQCGAIRYTLRGAPVVFYICHCTECQKQSASAFGESFRVRQDDLEVDGAVATFTRIGTSGNELACDFCPDCGTRLFHRRAKYSETMNIKAGTLDDTSWLRPAGHIWVRSKQPWVKIGANELTYERQPEDGDAALTARWEAMLAG